MTETSSNPVRRARFWYALILLMCGIFVIRLFYLQVIRHEHYTVLARSDQLREYDVMPERGAIFARLGDKEVPLVLNQRLFTIYADPQVIKKPHEVATKVGKVLNIDQEKLEKALKAKYTRYVVLKKHVSKKDAEAVLKFRMPGVASIEKNYRTYPQGSLASQVLGFVDEDGAGKYGLEQALNSTVGGKNGRLKAVTDARGVPLASANDNFLVRPVAGSDVTLTIDMGMQAHVEDIVKRYREQFRSKRVSAIVAETNTGAIKAMANYPTFDPENYQNVEDGTLLQNASVTQAIEPGSITKVLSVATAIDTGAINRNSSFYNPGKVTIDDATITDVSTTNVGTQTIQSTLDKSLNTGAVWVLRQMGGGNINDKARSTLFDYYTKRFNMGKETGIEQGYEAAGYIVGPEDTGSGINLTYANMAFGQAYSATALQMNAALSSVINGGTYYRPRLVESINTNGSPKKTQPEIIRSGVVSQKTSDDMVSLLESLGKSRVANGVKTYDFGPNYIVGGKSGTAEIAKPTGGYEKDVFNGTYMGFVGGDKPQYTIIVFNIEPKVDKGFAGTVAAMSAFLDISHMLVNSYDVLPKGSGTPVQ